MQCPAAMQPLRRDSLLGAKQRQERRVVHYGILIDQNPTTIIERGQLWRVALARELSQLFPEHSAH